MGFRLVFSFVLSLLLAGQVSAKNDILCPAESDKKPLAVYLKNSKVAVFACGSVDENRAPPPGKVWMTRINIYTLKDDGTPQPVLENESEVRNFFVNVEKNGIRADEIYIFDQTPQSIFSTYVNCESIPCGTKVRCSKPTKKFNLAAISRKTLTDAGDHADQHLRDIFRAGLSGDSKARSFFKNSTFKDSLDSFLRDQFDKYEQILKSYADLGC
jgi:hypothetical protein